MKKIVFILLAGFSVAFSWLPSAIATTELVATDVPQKLVPDSGQLELDLQRLPWEKFRAVVAAIPKLKADIDAYGSFGWEYVKQNYTGYHWKKNIDRLDPTQKQRLAELIQSSKMAK